MIRDDGRRARVLFCNAGAEQCGIRTGMSLAAARVLTGKLLVHGMDNKAVHEALRGLADWAYQFSSRVSLYPPYALFLEVQGSLSLFGGRTALLKSVRSGLVALGYEARLAAAPTPLAAFSLARCGSGRVVEARHELAAALAPLPILVLDWVPALLERLEGMGVRRLGDLLRLPRDGLARRLGQQSLLYLDRMLGRCPHPLAPYQPAPAFRRRLPLAAEVEQAQALLFVLQRLVLELCGWLQGRGAGVQIFTVCLLHRERCDTRLRIGMRRAGRDAGQFTALLREHLQGLVLQQPVIAVELQAVQPVRLDDRSMDLFRSADVQERIDLLDCLRARLGEEAVQGISAVAEHRPEYAWSYSEPGRSRSDSREQIRPLWLLAVPRPLETREGRPYWHGCLRLQAGRERIESGWWDGRDVARDYFVATSPSGSRYWIYRELSGERRWYLQGVFE